MKKILLAFAAVSMALASYAAIDTPRFYSEDFVKMGQDSDYPTDGWITYGTGAAPASGIPAAFFNEDGEGPYYFILNVGSESYVMANTVFADGSEPDEWLVSPEIEVPYDEAVIEMTAVGYAATGSMPAGTGIFKVLVSETGVEKEDFTDTILSRGTVNSSSSTELTTKKLVFAMNGYKGKKVHLAFVVTSKDVGFIGFSNIKIGQYAFSVTDYTKTTYLSGDEASIDMNFGLKTPVTATSFNTTIEVNDEQVFTQDYKKSLGATSSSTSFVMQRVKAEDIGIVTKEQPLNYTVIVTPDFEGAVPTKITGSISAVEYEYLSNIVLEEITATGCSACPTGLAALEYYTENYPGTDEVGKAIVIGVHGYINWQDPMGNTNEVKTYLQNALQTASSTTYPNVTFNRAKGYRGLYPAQSLSSFLAVMAEKSFNSVEITKVEMPELEEDESIIDKTLTVTFDVRNGYTSQSRELNAAVIVIENNVKGYDSTYSQENGLYNQTQTQFSSIYNSQFTPYAAKYLSGGELAMSLIPYSMMTYQHVLREAFPGYYGESISDVWEANEPQTFSMDFSLNDAVLNPEETEVIVLIIDPSSEEIVASDIMPYSEFVTTSGVNVVNNESNIKVYNENGVLKVKAAANGVVDVYSVDGKHLASYALNGDLAVNADWKGLVVVKVSTSSETSTAKLIF